MVQYFVQENKFYFILCAFLEFFKLCGYFLMIKKKTQGRFFDSKSGNSVLFYRALSELLDIVYRLKNSKVIIEI